MTEEARLLFNIGTALRDFDNNYIDVHALIALFEELEAYFINYLTDDIESDDIESNQLTDDETWQQLSLFAK